MVLDRTSKTIIAVITLVAALFLLIKHLVTEDPIDQWWLAGLLLVISISFWVWLWQEEQGSSSAMVVSEIQDDEKLPNMQEWIISKENPALKVADTPVSEIPTKTMPEPEVQKPAPMPAPSVIEKRPEPSVSEQIVEAGTEEHPIVEEAMANESPSVDQVAEAMAAPELPFLEKVVEEEVVEPVVTPNESVSGKPDDLTKLNGIGPKFKQVLSDAGISTFAQLADTSLERISEILGAAGVRRITNFETWPTQAGFLAKGDHAGLQKYLSEN